MAADRSITIGIATMGRPSIRDTLLSIDAQVLPDGARLDVVVIDNDDQPSAKDIVEAVAGEIRTPVTYIHAPGRNISLARNAALDAAQGQWLAYIDDDETASDRWIAELLKEAEASGSAAVLGPVSAIYPPETPAWMREQDHHSARPVRRDGEIQTGYAGNALLHLQDPLIAGERFLLSKGRTGGEDTEFFFRLWKKGVRIGAAERADVYEKVEPHRLSYDWLAQRKFRSGQSYGFHSLKTGGPAERLALLVSASMKVALCRVAAAVSGPGQKEAWGLRGRLHAGVVSASLGNAEAELYGGAPKT